MPNPHEELAREKKAMAIADLLTAGGFPSHKVAAFEDGQRRMAANAARVKMPSEETWALVVKLMRQRESISKEVAHA
jgi:hypothetical protein